MFCVVLETLSSEPAAANMVVTRPCPTSVSVVERPGPEQDSPKGMRASQGTGMLYVSLEGVTAHHSSCATRARRNPRRVGIQHHHRESPISLLLLPSMRVCAHFSPVSWTSEGRTSIWKVYRMLDEFSRGASTLRPSFEWPCTGPGYAYMRPRFDEFYWF